MAKLLETRDRTSLRLDQETLAKVDFERALRPGKISRNTWITEAIQEKLAREGAANDQPQSKRKSNG